MTIDFIQKTFDTIESFKAANNGDAPTALKMNPADARELTLQKARAGQEINAESANTVHGIEVVRIVTVAPGQVIAF